MRRYVDLHLHSCYSDGVKTPAELLDIVRSENISAFSITDHDTLEGYRAAAKLLTSEGPELIPGLELSVSIGNGEMHILAYLFDPENERLTSALERFQSVRERRGRLMVNKLNALGIEITHEDIERHAGGAVIGRPHVAAAMLSRKATKYYEEAFEKYIGTRGPAYVPKANFSPSEAISLVHEAGGLAVLAHPGIDDNYRFIGMLAEIGMDGVEIYHPAHRKSDMDRLRQLAKEHCLLVTGGSDYHGREGRYSMVGSQKVPYECLEQLRKKANKK